MDLGRLATWLAHRRTAIRQLLLRCDYPDALLALPRLVAPLAPGLLRLELRGAASGNWVHVQALDWGWLRQAAAAVRGLHCRA